MNKNIQPTEQSLQAFANNSNVITLKSFIAANDFDKSDFTPFYGSITLTNINE